MLICEDKDTAFMESLVIVHLFEHIYNKLNVRDLQNHHYFEVSNEHVHEEFLVRFLFHYELQLE